MRTVVDDVERGIYDIKNKDEYSYRTEKGLTEDVIRAISKEKNEPQWMLDFRLKSLAIYNSIPVPTWGPDLSELDIDNIITYVRPKSQLSDNWENVDQTIANTFDRLGIQESESSSLAGVGAQYDSEVVYHSIQRELEAQGVVYTDFETACRDYEEIVREYFMKCVPPSDHKFAALHGAVFSGGSFVYVPKGVQVNMPLQSYFRLNAPGAGQFEHTLIIVEEGASLHFIEGCSAPKHNVINLHAGCVELYVKENARLRYSTIENWSKNMYNLNTKRALIHKNAHMEWVSGSFGSRVSMLYPMSVLIGEGASSDFTGITFAAKGQNLDTGAKVAHLAPHTKSTIHTRSISKAGGETTYRGLVKISPKAYGSKASVNCDALMLDDISASHTVPVMDIKNDDVEIAHEAKIGKISDEAIFYLMSRGLTEEEAVGLIVRGFVDPIAKELPVAYAVELNNLINLEMKGTIG